MIYNIDNDHESQMCDVYPEEVQEGMIFLQPYEDVPTKRRKANDEFVLQRYSLVESTEQRKQRLVAKREERKTKLDRGKEFERSTTVTDHASSQEAPAPPAKDDSRKIRNRNSAQLSRDRKRVFLQQLIDDNQRLTEELETRNNQNRQLLEEIDIVNQKLRVLQDLRAEGTLKCPHCQQMVIPEVGEQTTYTRVQNQYSSRSLKTYGLLSLFMVITMLGCLGTVPGDGEIASMQLFQLRDKQMENYEDYFNKGNEVIMSDPESHYEPFQASPMEVTTLDNLRSLKNFKFDSTEDPQVYNFKVNIRTLEESLPQQLPKLDKTLFLNCTASNEKCDALIKIMASRNMNDIHQLSPVGGGSVVPLNEGMKGTKQYINGQEITILQVFEENDSLVMNTVKCLVEETSDLKLDHNLIEKLTL